MLRLNGRDVTSHTLASRRALLGTIRFRLPVERVTPLDGHAPWERACRDGWEGVIAKRLDSPYEHRRSKVGTGFETKLLLDLRVRLEPLLVPDPPFTKGTGLPRLRIDKPAAQVTRERP